MEFYRRIKISQRDSLKRKTFKNEPMKIEADLVNSDRVGWASDASGTAALVLL